MPPVYWASLYIKRFEHKRNRTNGGGSLKAEDLYAVLEDGVRKTGQATANMELYSRGADGKPWVTLYRFTATPAATNDKRGLSITVQRVSNEQKKWPREHTLIPDPGSQ